jgi:alpha-D-ribose 1-methylphosphonate 5-phosphate C-P lyase
VQVTAAILGPNDVLKVIDQGADDTTNAVSIRAFLPRPPACHDDRHDGGDHHPDASPRARDPLE